MDAATTTTTTQDLARRLHLFTQMSMAPPAHIVLEMMGQIEAHLAEMERLLLERTMRLEA